MPTGPNFRILAIQRILWFRTCHKGIRGIAFDRESGEALPIAAVRESEVPLHNGLGPSGTAPDGLAKRKTEDPHAGNVAWGPVRYLYVGSSDVARDVAHWEGVLGKQAKVWDFTEFDTRVAGFRVSEGPMWLVAGHRTAPNVLPIFTVEDLEEEVRRLAAAGWKAQGETFEVPDGPCRLFKDPSGNELCLMQVTRGAALER
jgi:predicted enzyme related to lactoylglutathione lyase